MRGRARSAVLVRSRLTSRGIWPRSNGRAGSIRSGCGRSRTAGRSRAGSSRRCWPPASASCVSLRSGWAPPGAGSVSRASLMRSTRSRSPARSSRTGSSASRARIWTSRRWRSGLLFDHRNDLVAERTRVINRLRWHLLELCPELERSLKRGSLNQSRVLDRVDRRLRQLGTGARVRVAREQVAQIRSLTAQIDGLKRELRVLVEAHRPGAARRDRLRRADRSAADRPH